MTSGCLKGFIAAVLLSLCAAPRLAREPGLLIFRIGSNGWSKTASAWGEGEISWQWCNSALELIRKGRKGIKRLFYQHLKSSEWDWGLHSASCRQRISKVLKSQSLREMWLRLLWNSSAGTCDLLEEPADEIPPISFAQHPKQPQISCNKSKLSVSAWRILVL